MKVPAFFVISLLLASCGSMNSPAEKALAHSQVQSTTHAIAAVRHDIQSRGGKPDAFEYRAGRRGAKWFVTAWLIVNPQAKGAARFNGGAFTTYIVSAKGYIVERLAGRE